jgi:uncharacterized ferritin-like protein (DUF455 family)
VWLSDAMKSLETISKRNAFSILQFFVLGNEEYIYKAIQKHVQIGDLWYNLLKNLAKTFENTQIVYPFGYLQNYDVKWNSGTM